MNASTINPDQSEPRPNDLLWRGYEVAAKAIYKPTSPLSYLHNRGKALARYSITHARSQSGVSPANWTKNQYAAHLMLLKEGVKVDDAEFQRCTDLGMLEDEVCQSIIDSDNREVIYSTTLAEVGRMLQATASSSDEIHQIERAEVAILRCMDFWDEETFAKMVTFGLINEEVCRQLETDQGAAVYQKLVAQVHEIERRIKIDQTRSKLLRSLQRANLDIYEVPPSRDCLYAAVAYQVGLAPMDVRRELQAFLSKVLLPAAEEDDQIDLRLLACGAYTTSDLERILDESPIYQSNVQSEEQSGNWSDIALIPFFAACFDRPVYGILPQNITTEGFVKMWEIEPKFWQQDDPPVSDQQPIYIVYSGQGHFDGAVLAQSPHRHHAITIDTKLDKLKAASYDSGGEATTVS